jgi:hypothetical protein
VAPAPATPASVLLLDGAPSTERLSELLGPERASALGRVLGARARAWAVAAFGADAVRVIAGSGLAAALAGAGEGAAGPVIAIAPELPAWRPNLAAAALDDLRAGCAVALGPIFDGGFYLLGLARPIPALLEVLSDAGARDPMTSLIAVAERERLEVGLLRTERGLRGPTDIRALLADPLTDAELRGLLE